MTVETLRRTPVLDKACAEAGDLARAAAVELAGPDGVGDHLACVAEDERLATHSFVALTPAYAGWEWSVTVVRASRSKVVTVDEVCLLPGGGALLAPAWVPYSERLLPGDLGPGDLLPIDPDDDRLEPGYTGGSLNHYDEAAHHWRQIWTDSSGAWRDASTAASAAALDAATCPASTASMC